MDLFKRSLSIRISSCCVLSPLYFAVPLSKLVVLEIVPAIGEPVMRPCEEHLEKVRLPEKVVNFRLTPITSFSRCYTMLNSTCACECKKKKVRILPPAAKGKQVAAFDGQSDTSAIKPVPSRVRFGMLRSRCLSLGLGALVGHKEA